MVERWGFEPQIQLPAYTLSRRAPSATRTSLLNYKQQIDSISKQSIEKLEYNEVSRILLCGTPEGSRTPGLLNRNQTLYPAELRVHKTRNSYAFSMVERWGFEPQVPLQVQQISNLPLSATQASLQQ
jgi:hypothetical protein